MSDYNPTVNVLKERFPGLDESQAVSGPADQRTIVLVAAYLMDQYYRVGDNVEAAQEGFTTFFASSLADGKAWAVESQRIVGRAPWDEDAYRAAVHSARTFHDRSGVAQGK